MHRAHPDFWKEYRALPADIRDRADKQFELLKANPRDYVWFWIGEHDIYEGMI